MLKSILKNLLANDLQDLSDSRLHVKIPFSLPIINLILKEIAAGNDKIDRIVIKEINGTEIKFDVTLIMGKIAGRKVELIDRELVIKLYPYLAKPEFLLKIEVLDGIGRIENEVLEILFNTRLDFDSVDFENRLFYIKHRELSDNKTYQTLLRHIDEGHLITEQNKIVYDLHLNFDNHAR